MKKCNECGRKAHFYDKGDTGPFAEDDSGPFQEESWWCENHQQGDFFEEFVNCEACSPKGPAWPSYLDFSKQAPYQRCCLWCNGTKEVTLEVALVYARLKNQRGLLSVRASTLRARATEVKKAWEALQNKKRPKGHSEIDWAAMLTKTELAFKTAHADALDAIREERSTSADVQTATQLERKAKEDVE